MASDAPAARSRNDDDVDGERGGDERQGEKRTRQMGVEDDDSPSCPARAWIRCRVR